MPIIVACPSCGGKLRVSDELRGQLVRCPACDHTFDSAPTAEPPPEPRDLPLQLTIDEPSSEPRPVPSNGTPGLVGAMELKLSLDDEPSSPPPPAEPSPSAEPPRTPPPRLADEHDDLKTCPLCGKHVHRDSTRCYNCGERFDGQAPDRDAPRSAAGGRAATPNRTAGRRCCRWASSAWLAW